jgi:3D (Asp-Asp-Asp) domain-containing protein
VALHISGKLCVLGLVIASLITAFSSQTTVPLAITPQVYLRSVELAITPGIDMLSEPRMVASSNHIVGPQSTIRLRLKSTAYNSLPEQTYGNPFVTATGARTAFGIIAVSRDLLGADLPYGSLVRIRDLGNYHNGRGAGRFQEVLDSQGLFIVEDTMHARKRQQIDVWFPHLSEAINWGVRQVEIEVVRYGRDGPEFYVAEPTPLGVQPKLAAAR